MGKQQGNQRQKQQDIHAQEVRIDFSFKREVFFIIAGALMGGIAMAFPLTFLSGINESGYDLTWIVFGHIVGVNSPTIANIIAGFMIHFLTATCIGIVAGVFLYKTNILNISKPSNGLRYGLLVGIIVYLVFAIPVEQFVLNQEFRRASATDTSAAQITPMTNNNNKSPIIPQITTIMTHLLFGITLGLFSSFLSMRFGARYRCPEGCDISFPRIDTLQNHLEFVHRENPIHTRRRRIVILGGGFGGVSVLNKLQDYFETDVTVDITMVSKDNYLLFTPMLHEVASGTLETRHIVTPVRTFCKRSRFFAATVERIHLERKQVLIRPSSSSPALTKILQGSSSNYSADTRAEAIFKSLDYDYLVIALGSETKFFGMSDIQKHVFAKKNLSDAIILRNHLIYLLEEADQLPRISTTGEDAYTNIKELQSKLLTIVVLGGGFAGVETAGEINDFVRDSAREYYHNIDDENIQVILVHSGNRLLPEMSEKLSAEKSAEVEAIIEDVFNEFGNRVSNEPVGDRDNNKG